MMFGRKIRLSLFLVLGLCATLQSCSAQTITSKDTAEVRFLNSRKFYIYKVGKGETLYSISQKFKIPQQEILEFNKDVAKDGLKNKMKIWIPAYSWLKNEKDSVVSEAIEVVDRKKTFTIGVISTLDLPKMYVPDRSNIDSSYVDEPIRREIKTNLEFIEGVMLSAKAMKKDDSFKSHLHIIDSEGDSMRLRWKLKKETGFNLIITNETGATLRQISSFCMTNGVKLISCGVNTTDMIRQNKDAISLLPSSLMQCELTGYFSAKYFPSAKMIALKTSSIKENERSSAFRTGYEKGRNDPFTLIDTRAGEEIPVDSLVKGKNNVIFVPSSNEDMVSGMLNSLKTKIVDYTVTIVGLPTWQYFESIDQKLYQECNVHLFSSGFIDYNSSVVYSFRKQFREKYNTDPGEAAYQGYDALTLAGKILHKGGKKSLDEKSVPELKGLYSEYEFRKTPGGEALENIIIHVFQPARDESIDLAGTKIKMKQ
jgi:LysM repeat protein